MTEIFYNGNFLPADETTLKPTSMAAMYGKGVFTTIAVFGSVPFVWEKHWNRLLKDAYVVGLDVSDIDETLLKNDLLKIISNNELLNGRVRITLFDETPAEMWVPDGKTKISVMMNCGAFRSQPDHFKLGISPYVVNTSSLLTGVKSCNYLENLMAIDEVRTRGSNEAVRVNELGEVVGGCMSNIFWSKDGRLKTPSLSTGCLPGTTRECILERIDCSEVTADLDELNMADAIFLTSAGIGIVGVNVYNGQCLENKPNAIFDLLPNLR